MKYLGSRGIGPTLAELCVIAIVSLVAGSAGVMLAIVLLTGLRIYMRDEHGDD